MSEGGARLNFASSFEEMIFTLSQLEECNEMSNLIKFYYCLRTLTVSAYVHSNDW